jgi:hypothetical protein
MPTEAASHLWSPRTSRSKKKKREKKAPSESDFLAHRTRASGDLPPLETVPSSRKTKLLHSRMSRRQCCSPHPCLGKRPRTQAAVELRVLSARPRRLLPLSEKLKRQEPLGRAPRVDHQLGSLPPVVAAIELPQFFSFELFASRFSSLQCPQSTIQTRRALNRAR